MAAKARSKEQTLVNVFAKRLFAKDDASSPVIKELPPAKSDNYQFYGNTLAAYESEADEIILYGPAGTGKSVMWLTKCHRLMVKYPGARAAIVRKTRASLTTTGLVSFEDDVLGPGHPLLLGKSGKRLDRENRSSYQYPNGSEIVVVGMDKATKVLSGQFDFVFVQEAKELTLEDWEHLLTRMRHGVIPYQQLAGDTNPDSQYHWIKQRDMDLLKALHEDNPRFYDRQSKTWTKDGEKYVFRTLNKLTGVRRVWFYEGEWASAEGAVYDNYDSAIHLIDPFPIPDHWRRIVSIDFGYTNPFVAQWWAIDHDGRMYLYREIYMSQRTVSKHADEIHRLNAGIDRGAWAEMDADAKRKAIRQGERIEAYICDHDAEDRATLHENGITTIAAKKAITMGIDLVRERFAVQDDGKARIFFMRGALVEADDIMLENKRPTCTEQEVTSYAYPKAADGKPVKELPVDQDNHGMDAKRYAVVYVDGGVKGGGRKVRVKNWGSKRN